MYGIHLYDITVISRGRIWQALLIIDATMPTMLLYTDALKSKIMKLISPCNKSAGFFSMIRNKWPGLQKCNLLI